MAYAVHNVEGKAERLSGAGPLIAWNAQHCPFAHRCMLALAAKNVPFERRDIDAQALYTDKPKEFLEVNPNGTVPGLNDGGKYLYESLLCVEYVDAVFKSPDNIHIMPEDPYKKYLAQLLVDQIGKKFIGPVVRSFFPGAGNREEDKANALAFLKEFFLKIKDLSDGPFFGGTHLGYVDIAIIPFIQRIALVNHFYGFTVPDNDEFAPFHAWWKEVQKTPAYIATAQPLEYLVKALHIHAKVKGVTLPTV